MQKHSREGKVLVDDALNCLFNSFDSDRSGRISFKKLSQGLDIFCVPDQEVGASGMFERNSEIGSSPNIQVAGGTTNDGQPTS